MRFLALATLLSLCCFGCEKEKPAAAPTPEPTAPTAAATTEPAPPAASSAAGMQKCSCTAAPTEACHPNCPPITWESADCDSAAGRPKACKEPAKH